MMFSVPYYYSIDKKRKRYTAENKLPAQQFLQNEGAKHKHLSIVNVISYKTYLAGKYAALFSLGSCNLTYQGKF